MTIETEKDELTAFEVAKRGIKIEDFLRTDVGLFFAERADRERKKAIVEFANCDITNQSEVQRIQNAIKIPDMIIQWLLDAIEEGRACEYELKADHERKQALSDSY